MLTACFITGTVMMNTISSTSMTSTSGVMLISFITSPVSSCVPKAMACSSGLLQLHDLALARADARAGHEEGMQVMGETIELVQHALVAAHQCVVAQHRGDRDRQAQRRHDQRLADRARHLVDGGLPRGADRHQRVVDAP